LLQWLRGMKHNVLLLFAILVFPDFLKCESQWRFMKIGPGCVSRTVRKNLPDSTGQSLSWRGDNRSVVQDIPCLSWNPKFH
jgi:hypothetical protein